MTEDSMSEITQDLQGVVRGESRVSEELLPLVYRERRHLAAFRTVFVLRSAALAVG
jgi:hypothetical protein